MYIEKKQNKIYKCINCQQTFIPKGHYGNSILRMAKFCSYKCSNIYSGPARRKPPKIRVCVNCNKEFISKSHYGNGIIQQKYCSPKCFGIVNSNLQRINDGLSKQERFRKKHGILKMHTKEWLDMIRAKTTDAMKKPEIQMKIRAPRQPLSESHRMKISDKLIGKMPKNIMVGSGSYQNVQRGDYENSKGTVYFRSKWEANYALYLDFLVERGEIKNWEYEVDVFIFDKIKFGTRSYRPDFKVFNNNGSFEYHEIKGYMDGRSKTKLKRMLKYYPKMKVVLVDGPSYLDIKKKLGKTLSFY